MSKIPVSLYANEPLSSFWERLLTFHVPQGRILDPTCGQRFIWEGVDTSHWEITYRDLIFGDDLFNPPASDRAFFDGIIYDPPYFFGVKLSDDPRAGAYGTYKQSLEELHEFMGAVAVLATSLVPGGKLIIKCADQFYVPERKLYLHHIEWLRHLGKVAEVVDFCIYKHARVSPTAWQVKNRPSSVIVHTYFIVGRVQ